MQAVRHCPFISKDKWTGDIKYPVPFATGEKVFLEECPSGFLALNRRFGIVLDAYTAFDKGHPIIWGVGYLDLPNIIVRGIEIVGEEVNEIYRKDRAQKWQNTKPVLK